MLPSRPAYAALLESESMSRLVPRRLRVNARTCALLVPLVLITAALVRANGGDENSVDPGAPQPSESPAPAAPDTTPAPAASAAVDLQLLTLRAGPGPYPWLVHGRIARSFI